ncbi:MAG: DNA-directed RNA polymerase subunit D [Candidatus Aenigmarchaeota archaeon]|nr:DNA-directed RNA polymerase subunit D [Candidatus Aenigmarchaeota archaeon]
MKVNIIDKTDKKITFLLEDTNPQFANALRRISMTEIPNLAVQTADVSKNDTVLYDEIIAHRLAMIPLVFKQKDFEFKQTCKCEGKGCSQCEVVFAINKKGPCTVYSKDMKSSNPDVSVLYDNIPIVELKEDQVLKLEAMANLGTGRDHAKFKVAISSYRYYPIIKLLGDVKNADECMKLCPKSALDIKGSKGNVTTDCDLCQECVRLAQPNNIQITGDNTKFIFTIESISGLSAEEILTSAVKIFKEKAQELVKDIQRIK